MEKGLREQVRDLNVFDGLALLIVVGLVGAGFFIGSIGGGETGTTTTVEITITPEDQVRPLATGETRTFPLYIRNPTDLGVRVASISAGSSAETAGCAAGTITSAPVEGPTGFINPTNIRAYDLYVTMDANADSKCREQSFTLPLTVELATAAADR